MMTLASVTAHRPENRLEYERSTKSTGKKPHCCVKRFRSIGCRLELEPLKLPVGGGGRGPAGGGAGRIGRLKASPVLGRFVFERIDVLEVRGGKIGRSKIGAGAGYMPPLTSAESPRFMLGISDAGDDFMSSPAIGISPEVGVLELAEVSWLGELVESRRRALVAGESCAAR